MHMLDQEMIERITAVIVETANPTKVLLFGSYAVGDATSDSDLDIMVIVHDSTPDTRDLACRLHLKVSSVIELPCDILVEHESVFEQRGKLPSLERTVLETGQVLYAA